MFKTKIARSYLSGGFLSNLCTFVTKFFLMQTIFPKIKCFHIIGLFLFFIVLINDLKAQEKSSSRSMDTSLTIIQKKSVPVIDTKEAPVVQQYPITISKKAGEEQLVHDENYFRKEISRVQNHISAIDHKVSSVSADSLKKQKAEEEGWFDQMSKIRASLVQEQQRLESELEFLNR